MRRFLATFLAAVALLGGAAVLRSAQPPADAYLPGVLLANLKAAFIDEASGIVASRRNPGALWINNDSGDGAYLYAVDRKGETRGVFLVRSASASDWEDIAWGPGPDGKGDFLYIGDIGDNGVTRTDCAVYRIPEPKIGRRSGTKREPLLTEEPTIRRTFAYPDGPHNAEALLVHPKTGILYIVTKEPNGVSGVYKFPAEPEAFWEKNTLIRVGTVTISGETVAYPNLVTGGDIAPDGRRVILLTYERAYELTLPDGAADFDAIWSAKPNPITTPPMPQAEAICYALDGKSLLTTSEQDPAKSPAPLYELRAKTR